MPFDGSGNFNRALGPTTWQNDAAAGIKIKADLHDNNDNDIANGLSQVICKDGQSSPTADITLNGHKLINVANPSNPQDAMTLNTFSASAVRYDTGQALSIAQQLTAHTNLAATMSVAIKSGAYSLLQADRGKLLRITAAATITLPAATAVGNDFSVDFRTMGGVMTLAPNGTNQIEGVNANYLINDGATGTLWCDGTNWWVSKGAGTIIERLITANETYTKPAGLKYLEIVEGCSPGGGGGGTAATSAGQWAAGGGGGAGGWGSKLFPASAIGATEAVVIGAPGVGMAGSGLSGAGGTTSFGALMSITGGGGGDGDVAGTAYTGTGGGIGGICTGGTLNVVGSMGSGGTRNGNTGMVQPGMGGISPYGSGLQQAFRTGGGNGTASTGFGTGGQGACNTASSVARTGGNGAAAFFRIREIF